MRYLIAYRGDKITEADATAIIEELRHHGQIVVDQQGAVTYQLERKKTEQPGAVPYLEHAPRRSQPMLL